MSTLLLPNSELVACAWLAQVPGFTAAMVGTTLPRLGPTGPLPDWVAAGFVTVAVGGGTPGSHAPLAEPALSVNCWAVNATCTGSGQPINVSPRPPWGKAAQLAEQIRHAVYVLDKGATRAVSMPVPGYAGAAVMSALLLSEPRRVPADIAGFARTQFDLQLDWVTGSL
ncbi:MAG: hypothetical protein YHS30scaffold324_70 [Catenulispora phage 69_17]|nr:MAG: hypothetical protein YHS30scaffold324_70 [Catenulispora phage 69_17]